MLCRLLIGLSAKSNVTAARSAGHTIVIACFYGVVPLPPVDDSYSKKPSMRWDQTKKHRKEIIVPSTITSTIGAQGNVFMMDTIRPYEFLVC